MGQTYSKYDGTNSIKTEVGLTYPDSLAKENINGSAGSIGWSPDGSNKYDYNVVAIYNYDATQGPNGRITYLFAFHNGQPIALVDQSNNGEPTATETKNSEVKTNFEKIANTKATSSTAKISVSDPRIVGIILHETVQPDDDLSREPNVGVYVVDGYYVMNNGINVATIFFKINGNSVDYWTRAPDSDLSEADTVPNHGMIKKTIASVLLKNSNILRLHRKTQFKRLLLDCTRSNKVISYCLYFSGDCIMLETSIQFSNSAHLELSFFIPNFGL